MQRAGVDDEVVAQAQGLGFAGQDPRTPQHGVDAQHQLGDREGLGDVIVGAQRQAVNDVLIGAARGEQDDGLLAIVFAYAPADLEAVQTRQHHVQQYQVMGPALRLVPGIKTVDRAVHLKTVVGEHVNESAAYGGLVFDDEDAGFDAHVPVISCAAGGGTSIARSARRPCKRDVNTLPGLLPKVACHCA